MDNRRGGRRGQGRHKVFWMAYVVCDASLLSSRHFWAIFFFFFLLLLLLAFKVHRYRIVHVQRGRWMNNGNGPNSNVKERKMKGQNSYRFSLPSRFNSAIDHAGTN